MALKDKQKKFCVEYLVDFNATQAAIRAGYSKKTAAVIGTENLRKPNIQKYIQSIQQKDAENKGITREHVLEGYRKLAFYDSKKFYDDEGGLKSVPDLDDETAFALSGLEVTEEKIMGNVVGFTKKIRMTDRKAALDSICKMLGFNAPDKKEVSGPNGESLFKSTSNEELQAILNKISKRLDD